ncbi:hypothetical protein V1I91_02535 [Maribacter cobaltidurans]|uniref:Uncharacterized protein n=1 Tax=Maribacter cobaltidurans TaxID=1178778 RepID=A0ABU7IPP3_9FLAO|nr:hypothetical protein [Maribacter cobaltidurans]
MPGHMNGMQGSAENEPVGSIRILEDLDHDGVEKVKSKLIPIR